MKRLIIVGGGPSGMMAAISASHILDAQFEIVLIEKNDRLGKKILATGNGKCNFTNSHNTPTSYNDPLFAEKTLNQFDYHSSIAFFNSLGVMTKTDEEGRCYPYNDASSTILDALRLKVEEQGIKVELGFSVQKIIANKNGFNVVSQSGQTLQGDALIIACGGKASANLGSDGSIFPILENLGHHITKMQAAITQIKVENSEFKSLQGIKVHGRLTLKQKNQVLKEEEGEILFKEDSLSGITTFIISSFISRIQIQNTHADLSLSLDLLPNLSQKDCLHELYQRKLSFAKRPIHLLLQGMFVKMVGQALLKQANIQNQDALIESLTNEQMETLMQLIKAYPIKMKEVNSFIHAQVTCGGVDLVEVDPSSLQSKIIENLYFSGEVLNIDGECGGHNLQWAFSSGYVAGFHAAYHVLEKNKGGVL